MPYRFYVAGVLLLLWGLTACSPADDEVLPTLAAFPTNTSVAMAATTTPIPTVTAAPTDTPTVTPLPQASDTPAPTSPPTNTPPPSATFTPVLTSTPTSTNTPAATPTTTQPIINVFQANKQLAPPGDTNLRLRWQADADEGFLERIDANGNVATSFPVEPQGASQVDVPQTPGAVLTWRLVMRRGENQTSRTLSIRIEEPQPDCAIEWFFSAAATTPCPRSAPETASIEYQPFQNGFMFRIQVSGMDRVCAVQQDRNLYSCYAYTPYAGTPPASPPPELQAPGSSFQAVYYDQLAIGGLWYNIIGWGTAATTSTNASAQYSTDGGAYVQLPNGIYRFDDTFSRQQEPVQQANTGG